MASPSSASRSLASSPWASHAFSRTTLLVLTLAVALSVAMGAVAEDEVPKLTPQQASLTKVGEVAPAIEITTLDGQRFDLAALGGKVVLVNFWATWCPPCIQEMPHLEAEVWERFAGEDFAMVGIAREEGREKLEPWLAKNEVGFPIAGDTDRSVYAQFAVHTIPRNYVIGPDGTIIFQSIGFERAEFDAMIQTIERALAELHKS